MAEAGIAVVGGGTMGLGILRAFAGCGRPLTLVTRDPAKPRQGLPDGTRLAAGFEGPPPALLIESVAEDMGVKREVLARAEAAWGGRTIIASNTSVLPLQEIAGGLAHPGHFLGLHFMHPAETWALVEMIAVAETLPATCARTTALLAEAGRQPVPLRKPIPGALVNRLQHAMANEAYHMIADGAVDAETVDLVIRRILAPRMAITGLIEQKDLSGLVTHAISQAGLVPLLDHSGEAAAFLADLVRRGETGAQAGRGFYDWRGTDPAAFRAFAARRVQQVLGIVAEAETERQALAPRPRRHGAGSESG